MKRYEFTRTVVVDGRKFEAGDIVTPADVSPGYFESCVRVGHLRELPPAPAKPPEPSAPAKPAARK